MPTLPHTTNWKLSSGYAILAMPWMGQLTPEVTPVFLVNFRWGADDRTKLFVYQDLGFIAGMAELADAADSKSADRKVVGVRPPLPAPQL